MNAVKQDVEKLVQKELESANQKFPVFHSDYEGAAVIFGEIEETKDELIGVEYEFENLWRNVKNNYEIGCSERAENISITAVRLACEAIQVAAMAQKFIDSQKERENQK